MVRASDRARRILRSAAVSFTRSARAPIWRGKRDHSPLRIFQKGQNHSRQLVEPWLVLLFGWWVLLCIVSLWSWSWLWSWCVWCGTMKNPVCPSKTLPCVHSKRPRVYRHHAHMCFNMCAWCRHTRVPDFALLGHKSPPFGC